MLYIYIYMDLLGGMTDDNRNNWYAPPHLIVYDNIECVGLFLSCEDIIYKVLLDTIPILEVSNLHLGILHLLPALLTRMQLLLLAHVLLQMILVCIYLQRRGVATTVLTEGHFV